MLHIKQTNIKYNLYNVFGLTWSGIKPAHDVVIYSIALTLIFRFDVESDLNYHVLIKGKCWPVHLSLVLHIYYYGP